MTTSAHRIGQQLRLATILLGRRPVQIALLAFALTLPLSILLAPDVEARTSDWVRLIAIGVLAAAGVLFFATASHPDRRESDRQTLLIAAGAAVILALALCLTFSLGTALVFSVGISLVTYVAGAGHDQRSPWALTGALLVATPAFVWSALDAWTWGLLLLVPLCLIGVVSDGHMRAANALAPTITAALTSRGHRLAGWLGVLVAALLILVTGLPGGNANGILALGAAGAIVLVAIDALSRHGTARAERLPLVDVAMLWVIFCWIVSFQ